MTAGTPSPSWSLLRGYSIKDPTSQQVYMEAGRGKVVTFENTPLSAIIVKKVDSSTGDPLQGAWFRVRFLGGHLRYWRHSHR